MTGLVALDATVAGELQHLVDGIWDGRINPALVERCRVRICSLLGADQDTARHRHEPDADHEHDADHEPDADHEHDARDEACLAFAEQWMLDAHAITDELAAEVRRHLSDVECAAFTITLAVLEAQIRAELALAALR